MDDYTSTGGSGALPTPELHENDGLLSILLESLENLNFELSALLDEKRVLIMGKEGCFDEK